MLGNAPLHLVVDGRGAPLHLESSVLEQLLTRSAHYSSRCTYVFTLGAALILYLVVFEESTYTPCHVSSVRVLYVRYHIRTVLKVK